MTRPPDISERRAAEQWFLAHGLPAVLRPGRLVARVWSRSAPALAAFAVFMVNSAVVVLVTGKHTIDINGTPTRTEWFVLALLLLVLPAAAAVGWLVSRIRNDRLRTLAAAVSIAAAVVGGILGGPSPRVFVDLVLEAVVIGVVLACTATGIGAILGWAVRTTVSNLALAGALFVRALPVVLLTVLVFFNTYVWLMAEMVSRVRMWLAIGFLILIAAAFLVSGTVERVRPMLLSTAKSPEDVTRLAGTPFEHLPDRPHRVALSRTERANVVFVLAMSQIVQVMTVSVVTSGIFFVLGLILLSPELLAAWTRNGSPDGEILGMILPVPQALIHTTMFLTALTFMYLAARAFSDVEYRTRFVDPLVDDLRLTLVARDRYRTHTKTR